MFSYKDDELVLAYLYKTSCCFHFLSIILSI